LVVALTFDDAFANLIGNAFPELVQRGIPATVFVPSGNLGRRPAWRLGEGRRDASERVMTAEQVRGVASSRLFTVGSHTVRHATLTELADDELDHELTMSRVHLEGLTGASVDSIALPYGVYDGRVLDHARRAGYTRALSIEPMVYRVGESSFLMGRVRVEPDDWRVEFWLKLRGAYQWLALLRGFRHRRRQPGVGAGGARH
jgi:peptidoglycan/xylan/chitin deacetylase (PgdA/CDA1 family)